MLERGQLRKSLSIVAEVESSDDVKIEADEQQKHIEKVIGFINARSWLFPICTLVIFVLLVSSAIHGSSIGYYHKLLYGSSVEDSSLILSEPRAIRSDEWQGETPYIVAQSKNNFPEMNEHIGDGADMTVIFDGPHTDWTTFFKPRNFGFFVLPLANAYAFRWWFMGLMLANAAYLFCRRTLALTPTVSSLFSIALFFTPMLQWWYRSYPLGPIYFGLLACVAANEILRTESSRKRLFLLSVGLAYAIGCLSLLQYLPYQLMGVFAAAAFISGDLLNQLRAHRSKISSFLLTRVSWLFGAASAGACVFVAFYITRQDTIGTVLNSAFPGERRITPGGTSFERTVHLLTSNLSPVLLKTSRAATYSLNQSEASNFLVILPWLVPAIALVLWRQYKKREVDFRLVFVTVATSYLIAFQFFGGTPVFPLIDRVPFMRMKLGIGILQFMILGLLFVNRHYLKDRSRILVASWFLAVSGVHIWASVLTRREFPRFIIDTEEILVSSFVFGVLGACFLSSRYYRSGLLLLAGYSVFSGALVNPLYRNIDIVTDNKLVAQIEEINEADEGIWISDVRFPFQTMVAASGAETVTGKYYYPSANGFFASVDAKNNEAGVYNRAAHFRARIQEPDPEKPNKNFDLKFVNQVHVLIDPCSAATWNQKVSYVLSDKKLSSACLKEIKSVAFPSVTFRIYEVLSTA